ncbi:MAG: cellulase family glycosylhydrolase [Lentisphaeria bacterium]|nr:cellulase family glycosylhydrolase [Lentisphaeria bacterium]
MRTLHGPLVIAFMGLGMAAISQDKAQIPSSPGPKRGDTVLTTSFDTEAERAAWPLASWAQWVEEPGRGWCLEVTAAPESAAETRMVGIPLDLRRVERCRLQCTCLAKARDVSRPPQAYNGVKFMLHTVAAGGPAWQNQNGVFGTFDWKPLGFSVNVPEDVREAWLYLGLQESSGTVRFDDIRIAVAAVRPPRPLPDPDAPPPYTGHALPRLRGVMSPNTFRDEDLRVLGTEWKANLIRWQMTTRWGAEYGHGQDYDLTQYDAWLAAELDDLDKALEACARYGILAVIDLHSPPGGRRPDRDLVLIHERPYLDHFVRVWERIARRTKDHAAVWAYDLVNEPVQNGEPSPGMPDYLGAQVLAATAIRAIDPNRAIIIEVDHWDGAEGFRFLEPVPVPNVVYQVHMYHPHAFTHQGVHNQPVGIAYPGSVNGVTYDREALRKHLAPVREFQLGYNVHVYVGEFSAIRWAPDHSAFRYLRDCIEIFEEYGWDWSYHAYREWDGWSVEHGDDPNNHSPTAEPTARKQLLLDWFARNRKP